jgi:phage-related protein
MKQKFNVVLLGEVWDFLDTLDEKSKDKILYNIDKAKYVNDPELFKKIEDMIWEFRSKYRNTHYRLLSFWDKTDKTDTWVIATHGIVKKTGKMPKTEIEKAKAIMKQYFEEKQKNDGHGKK